MVDVSHRIPPASGVVHRVLPAEPVRSLSEHVHLGGGRGLEAARRVDPAEVIAAVSASGLRGRGGGGFPTGTKWSTVVEYGVGQVPPTVVVNAAEGEPGTFKDRAVLRANPYGVIEGALIAAHAVGADRIVVALKQSFEVEQRRVGEALAEMEQAGWFDGVAPEVVAGPSEYLFGEETGLLEVLDGRPPFPRLAPPFRHGLDEAGEGWEGPAETELAEPGLAGPPPALVNNVETLANVPLVLADGPDAFRSLGTPDSPGSVVCTISGATRTSGVAEVEMGTPLATAIELIGGGPRRGRRFVAALSGVAGAPIPAELFDTPLTYEDMRLAGSGLGSAGFIVIDDSSDPVAVAAGVSRFLAVESCGQCTPCKQDGLAVAVRLGRLCDGDGTEDDLAEVVDHLGTITDGARCSLAQQHQTVVAALLSRFPDAFRVRADSSTPSEPVAAELVVPLEDITVSGKVALDTSHRDKNADWTHGDDYSGQSPVDRLRVPATGQG